MNMPDVDPNNPVIVLYIIQEGVKSVDSVYTEPFHKIKPLSTAPQSGTYKDLAGWTSVALDSPPCQQLGIRQSSLPHIP